MKMETLKRQILTAKGDVRAELVLKNARVINVFTNEIEQADVAICQGIILGVGHYTGETELDLQGKYVCPGLVDGHIHIESSMLCGPAFEQAVLPHGTTAVVTDPHEISNVAGTAGLDFMLETTKDLALSVYFMLPSCVPATGLDESGAVLEAEQLRPYYQQSRVLGLAELMNSYGTVRADEKILQKIRDCTAAGKKIDGHAPFLSGEELNAYVAAGVQSDHECSDIHEAMEKLRRGQYIMVREGTAAQNMDSLLPLFREPYCSRCMLVTDDKHPGDLLQGGHIDYIIRKAIAAGVDPVVAVRMGTLVPCQYFGLAHSGAVAPGYTADLIVLSDLEKFTVEQVYKKGKLVAQQGKMLHPAALAVDKARFARVFDSFNMDEITPEQLQLKQTGTRQRVICLTPHSLLTTEKIVPFCQHPGTAPGVDVTQQIVKLAVFERHHRSGHVGLGFLGNYGLQCGAVAFQHCPRFPQPHRGGHQRCRHGAGGQHGAQKQGRPCLCTERAGSGRAAAAGGRAYEHRERRDCGGKAASAQGSAESPRHLGGHRRLYDPCFRQPAGHPEAAAEHLRHRGCGCPADRPGGVLKKVEE